MEASGSRDRSHSPSASSTDGNNDEGQRSSTLSEREMIRKDMSAISFEDLQKLKETIGSLVFNNTVLGNKYPKKRDTTYKRANKNRPREMSSKKPVRSETQLNQVKQHTPRDPRFDQLCGTYDEKEFKSNYKFLKEVRKKDRVKLQEELDGETDPKRVKNIEYLIQRMDNQIREQEARDRKKEKERQESREISETLKRGERPVFKKKSEKRIESLVEKYEELKKTNKLQKHLERRSKKLATKDRKAMELVEH